MFRRVGIGFALWFAFCTMMSLAMVGGVGYAIWWGLSIAERAVEVQGTHQVQE